jgi:hypothetical protein
MANQALNSSSLPGFTPLCVPMKMNGAVMTVSYVILTPDLRGDTTNMRCRCVPGIGMSGQIDRWAVGTSTQPLRGEMMEQKGRAMADVATRLGAGRSCTRSRAGLRPREQFPLPILRKR